MFPEPWHISFQSIAEKAFDELTINVLDEVIKNMNIRGCAEIFRILPDIFRYFILNIDPLSDQARENLDGSHP